MPPPRFKVRGLTLRFDRVVAARCAIGWKVRLLLLCGVAISVGHHAALVTGVAEIKSMVRAIVVDRRVGVSVTGFWPIVGVRAVYVHDCTVGR